MNWSTPLTELFWKQLNLFNEDNNQSQIRSYFNFFNEDNNQSQIRSYFIFLVISVNSEFIQPSELGTIWHLTAYDDVNDVRDRPTSHANCCFQSRNLVVSICRERLVKQDLLGLPDPRDCRDRLLDRRGAPDVLL